MTGRGISTKWELFRKANSQAPPRPPGDAEPPRQHINEGTPPSVLTQISFF